MSAHLPVLFLSRTHIRESATEARFVWAVTVVLHRLHRAAARGRDGTVLWESEPPSLVVRTIGRLDAPVDSARHEPDRSDHDERKDDDDDDVDHPVPYRYDCIVRRLGA
jgi:hypothetical protein